MLDFNGVVVKENYLKRSGRNEWVKKVHILALLCHCSCFSHNLTPDYHFFTIKTQFRDASDCDGDAALLNVMGNYSNIYK